MDISVLSSNPVILFCGALLVVIVTWYIFRSNSNKGEKKEKNKKGEIEQVNVHGELSLKKTISENKKQSVFIKMKQTIFHTISSSKKLNIPVSEKTKKKPEEISDKQKTKENNKQKPAIEEKKMAKEDIPETVEGNVLPTETTVKGNLDDLVTNNIADPVEQTIQTESIPNNDANKTPEVIPPVEKVGEPEKQKSEKSGSGSDIFSMFTDEGGEQSEASQFAANLPPITIDNLLKEIDDLKKHLRR